MSTPIKLIRFEHHKTPMPWRFTKTLVAAFACLFLVMLRYATPYVAGDIYAVGCFALLFFGWYLYSMSQEHSAQIKRRFCDELAKQSKAYLIAYSQSPEVSEKEKELAVTVLNQTYPGWSLS